MGKGVADIMKINCIMIIPVDISDSEKFTVTVIMVYSDMKNVTTTKVAHDIDTGKYI